MRGKRLSNAIAPSDLPLRLGGVRGELAIPRRVDRPDPFLKGRVSGE
jgi:hypothetical protein